MRSLGATFLELPLRPRPAKAATPPSRRTEFLARQQELIADDGRRLGRGDHHRRRPRPAAPRLVSTAMIERHAAGLGDRRPGRGFRREHAS